MNLKKVICCVLFCVFLLNSSPAFSLNCHAIFLDKEVILFTKSLKINKALLHPVGELNLSVPTRNILKGLEINYLGDLVSITEKGVIGQDGRKGGTKRSVYICCR